MIVAKPGFGKTVSGLVACLLFLSACTDGKQQAFDVGAYVQDSIVVSEVARYHAIHARWPASVEEIRTTLPKDVSGDKKIQAENRARLLNDATVASSDAGGCVVVLRPNASKARKIRISLVGTDHKKYQGHYLADAGVVPPATGDITIEMKPKP